MNKKEIVEVLQSLHEITGFRVSLHGADYEEIAAFPRTKQTFCHLIQQNPKELDACVKCDALACRTALENKETYIYKCRYGLTEAISPLYNFGHLTGYLIMGQVIASDDDMTYAERIFSHGAPDIKAAISDIPVIKSELIDSYVRIMTVCARYLTLSNAIIDQRPTLSENAKRYIHDNYGEKIGINELCQYLCCSKSTLVKLFKKECGTTVGSYIMSVRLAEAERLLRNSEYGIGEIARECGFCDQSYFSKVFVSKNKMTPTDYRNSGVNK